MKSFRGLLSRRGLFRIAQRMLEIMLIERVENRLPRSLFCISPHMGAVAPADLANAASDRIRAGLSPRLQPVFLHQV